VRQHLFGQVVILFNEADAEWFHDRFPCLNVYLRTHPNSFCIHL
jgi:hypothetical protein